MKALYRGPEDERDPGNVFVLPVEGGDDLRLPLNRDPDATVEAQGVEVTAEQRTALEAQPGQRFDFGGGSSDGGPSLDDLKAKARERGLAVGGSKADLQTRIDEHDAAQGGGDNGGN